VFYVSPRFHRLDQFNLFYARARVSAESAWIPVSSLRTINDDIQHHVSYRTGSDVRFASPESEPVLKTFSGEELKTHLIGALEAQRKEMTVESILQLRASLLDILKSGDSTSPELFGSPVGAFQIFKDITYLSRTFFGAEFLFAHRPKNA
jgi:hypothetical protein